MILGSGTFAQATFAAVAVGLPALRSHYALTLGLSGAGAALLAGINLLGIGAGR